MRRTLPFLAVLALAAVSSASLAAERQTFSIHQDPPDLNAVDLAIDGASHGDMLAFEAPITHDDGTAGTLRGILITVDLPGPGGEVDEDRIGQLQFDLGGGNSLVVAGGSVYPAASAEMAAGNAQVRAVIGGTGTFIGARGQVTTVRDADGSYDHKFELVD